MKLAAALAMSLALAGCMDRAPPVAAAPVPLPKVADPARTELLPGGTVAVMRVVEQVAVVCWLDARFQAANVLVDRRNDRVSVVDETTSIVVAEVTPYSGEKSAVILSGEAPQVDGLAALLRRDLRREAAGRPLDC